ncbi:MAG: tetratricopeptide repeat protein [Alphaproteobacteria bacterium]|nr:tetratricopeptide repeat protein [Alphaproteobacteria bacterium]
MSKKNQKAPKDATELLQDVLYDEVTEDVHRDQVLKMWKKYRYLILLAIILVIGSLAAMEGYMSWRKKVRLAESDVYEQAAVLNAQGQTQEALDKYASLKDGRTVAYPHLAKMRQAGILFDEGKDTEALAILNQLRQDENAPETLRAISALGYVSHQIETGNVAELQSILNPYLTVGNSWYGTAAEMSILLMIREGQNEKAKKMTDEVLSMSNLPSMVKEHLTVIKKVLEE